MLIRLDLNAKVRCLFFRHRMPCNVFSIFVTTARNDLAKPLYLVERPLYDAFGTLENPFSVLGIPGVSF